MTLPAVAAGVAGGTLLSLVVGITMVGGAASTSFRGFRVYDLAKVMGRDTTMPEALVQGLFDVVIPHVEEWRTLGVFGPEIPVPEGADPQTRLLCLAGHPL